MNELPNLPLVGDTLNPELLRIRLESDHEALLERFAELELGAQQIPQTIDSEQAAKRVVNWWAQQCTPLITQAKAKHADAKKPYLACSRLIDDFFLRRIDRFTQAIAPVRQRAADYRRRKEAEVRAAEAEQRRLAYLAGQVAGANALRLEAEAKKNEAAGERRAAIELHKQADEEQRRAEQQAAIAEAPGAPVGIHGEFGATAFAKEGWTYEVEDPAAVPEGFKCVDDAAVKAAIRRGVREISGIRIYPVDQFIIRRC